MPTDSRSLVWAAVLVGGGVWWFTANSPSTVPVRAGDSAKQGGSPTVRVPYERVPDDPATTNDESNDQPLGHFGRMTLHVTYLNSGNIYPVDADVSGTTVERIYFRKGGWVDFLGCDLDQDYTGPCEDENGREWMFEGEG